MTPLAEDTLKSLESRWGIGNATITAELTPGKSGSKLFKVMLSAPGRPTFVIIKATANKDTYTKELDAYLQIRTYSDTFSRHYITTLSDYWEHNGLYILAFTIATNSLQDGRPLTQALGTQQCETVLKDLSTRLITDWNGGLSGRSRSNILEIIRLWLGYRTTPSHGGRIFHNATELLGLTQASYFTYNDDVLPNPIALLYGTDSTLSAIEVLHFTGRSHGDLHAGNIIFNPLARPTYAIIDVSEHQVQNPLFFDQAYLEFTCLDALSANEDFAIAIAAKASFQPSVFKPMLGSINISPGIKSIIAAIRSGTYQHLKIDPSTNDELTLQYLLAHVGVGLLFIHRSTTRTKLLAACLHAAFALRAICTRLGIEAPRSAPPMLARTAVSDARESARELLRSLDFINPVSTAVVLLLGKGAFQSGTVSYRALAKLGLVAIFDLDPQSRGPEGLYTVLGEKIRAERPLHLLPITSSGAQELKSFMHASAWIFSSRHGEDDSLTLKQWKQQSEKALQAILRAMATSIPPRQLLIISLHDISESEEAFHIMERIDVSMQIQKQFVVFSQEVPEDRKPIEDPDWLLSDSSRSDFLSNLDDIFGGAEDDTHIVVPCRAESPGDARLISLASDSASFISEDFQIIHGGLANDGPYSQRTRDFFLGATATWSDIDGHLDVARSATSQYKETLTNRLSEAGNHLVHLMHAPGAGGTTFAKRLAWDLKNTSPTLWCRRLSATTPERVGRLHAATRLTVLIVAESADVSSEAIRKLHERLVENKYRAVILFVERHSRPVREALPYLPDPMDQEEVRRFNVRFAEQACCNIQALRTLVERPEYARYRSPVFFGLFAFDEAYQHIDGLIDDVVASSSRLLHLAALTLAVATVFAQRGVSGRVLLNSLGLDRIDGRRTLELLPECIKRISIETSFDEFRLVHPILGRELVNRISKRQNLKQPLVYHDTATRLIEIMTEVNPDKPDSDRLLLQQLLISRNADTNPSGTAVFSGLIQSIESVVLQEAVLRKLCDHHDQEAHFLAHLGRFLLYRAEQSVESCGEFFDRAIALNEGDDVLHHARGMAYRITADRVATALVREGLPLENVVEQISDYVREARNSFERSRALAPDSPHGFVAEAKMMVSLVGLLFQASGCSDYPTFLSTGGIVPCWCQEMLNEANHQMERVQNSSQRKGDPNFVADVSSRLGELMGDHERALAILSEALSRGDMDDLTARRGIANLLLRKSGRRWDLVKEKDLKRIFNEMESLLSTGLGAERDVLMWFQCFRRMKGFNIQAALERFVPLAISGSTVANFYVFALTFCQWQRKEIGTVAGALDALQACFQDAAVSRKTFSLEWLGRPGELCPIISADDLRITNPVGNEQVRDERLTRLRGTILEIKGPQAGWIEVSRKIKAFFVPGIDFSRGYDEQLVVDFQVGFSFSGLRAWDVRRVPSTARDPS